MNLGTPSEKKNSKSPCGREETPKMDDAGRVVRKEGLIIKRTEK